ncbi:hypothetical protein Tco_1243916 [Tanacetum coccineum]
MYSASVDEIDVLVCFFDDQLTNLSPRNVHMPVYFCECLTTACICICVCLLSAHGGVFRIPKTHIDGSWRITKDPFKMPHRCFFVASLISSTTLPHSNYRSGLQDVRYIRDPIIADYLVLNCEAPQASVAGCFLMDTGLEGSLCCIVIFPDDEASDYLWANFIYKVRISCSKRINSRMASPVWYDPGLDSVGITGGLKYSSNVLDCILQKPLLVGVQMV